MNQVDEQKIFYIDISGLFIVDQGVDVDTIEKIAVIIEMMLKRGRGTGATGKPVPAMKGMTSTDGY